MKVDLVEIDNALKYYQINDINYKNKCYKCIDDLNSIKNFNNKAEEVYNILYKNNTIDTLWQRENEIELFGEQYNPFITSVLVLLGWKIHDKNMTNKNYTDTQKELYKKRVREALTNDIYVRKLERIRISQMIWAAYFINTKLIEVGRLQYERREDYIKIHIPSGEKLEIEKVLDSIQKAKVEIEKYLNLNNQINAIIDSNSNIAKFYSLFDVKDGPDATKAILNFVFKLQECDDYNNLPEHTSLQRILKKQLLEKKELKIGCGKLKNRNLKEYGKD